ncbi:MAG: phosphatase PAP2 family protein [Actinomycetes bacterium]
MNSIEVAAGDPAPTLRTLRTVGLRRSARDLWPGAALGAALLVVPWLLLALTDSRLTGVEESGFRFVNDLPDVMRPVLGPVMLLGTLGAWVVGVIAIGVLYRRAAPAVAVAVACWTSYLGAQIVKGIVARGRPADLLTSFVARSQADGFGFASGHAAVVAGAAAALSPWLPRPWRVVAWSLVVLVAIARVYAGVHLPLDVVAGVGIGLICGTVATVVAGTPDV